MTIEELGKRIDAALRLNKRIDNHGAEVRAYITSEFDGMKGNREFRICGTHQRITGGLVVLLEQVTTPTDSPGSASPVRGVSPPA